MGNLGLGVDIDDRTRDTDPSGGMLRAVVWIGRLCDVVIASMEDEGDGELGGTVC